MEENELTCVLTHMFEHHITTHFLVIDETTVLRTDGINVIITVITECSKPFGRGDMIQLCGILTRHKNRFQFMLFDSIDQLTDINFSAVLTTDNLICGDGV